MGTHVGVGAVGVQITVFLVFIIRGCIANCIRFVVIVVVNQAGVVIVSVEAIIGYVRPETGKRVCCFIGGCAIVCFVAIFGLSSVLVNRKSIGGVSIMFSIQFWLCSLCKCGKRGRSVGRVLSLFAGTKSAGFYGRHLGLFVIGANCAWMWLLVPFVSKIIQRT